MSKRHIQKRAAKAARRKKLLAERRKVALAVPRMSLAAQVRQIAVAPIHSCLISEALFDDGMGYLLLARKAADGRTAMITFLLDVYCVGVKDVILRLAGAHEIEEFIDRLNDAQPMVAIEPLRARKLLRDLVAWSRSIGLAPHPDYAAAEPLFGDVPADACDESFSFGKDGKPFLIQGPSDTPARTRKRIEALRRTLGDDGFDYILAIDDHDEFFDDDDTELADDFDTEADDGVESITGMRYDPEVAPDAARWQVASVLAAHLTDTLKAGAADNAAYNAAVERLTAESWRAEFKQETEDDRN